MCGIAGILRLHNPKDGPPPHPLESIPEAWLDILDESIKHRGPDGQGRFRDRATREDGTVVDVAFVHRRLSIIDHEGGHQPMVHDGRRLRPDLTYARGETPRLAHELCPASEHPDLVAVVFNGCIYNHRELREELEAVGHVFETDHSDTEVLAPGWREWNEALFARIESMHAVCVWDRATGLVTASRDQFGEKPLYLCELQADRTAWSSVPAGLIRLSLQTDHSVRLDTASLIEWIAMGYAPAKTPLESIQQLEPGSWRDSVGRSSRRAASQLDERDGLKKRLQSFLPIDRGHKAVAEAVDRAIDAAVARRLEADVPVACFLSGGIDSAMVAQAASRHVENLTTFCVRMPDGVYDESEHARRVAAIIGSDHHEISVGAEPAEDLVSLIHELGLPFGDSSLLPTHWVSMAAAEHVGVAIGGDGGDELFLGYERYSVAGDLVPAQALALLSVGMSPRFLPRRNPKSQTDKAARFLTAAGRHSYRSLLAIYQHPELGHLLTQWNTLCRWNDRANNIRLAQAYDLDNHLPGDMLRKVDTASMACALEVRSPLLDRTLAQLTLEIDATRLRTDTKPNGIRRVRRKGLLRSIAREHFSSSIVDRPKQGFAIPIGEWFRSDYGDMRQLLYDHLESSDPFPGLGEAGVEINMGFVQRMLREHDAAGEKSLNPWHGRDHSQRLYMLLVLSIWAKWLEGVRRGAADGGTGVPPV